MSRCNPVLMLVGVLAAAFAPHVAAPPGATAAFELRDASPAALGAVSLDREASGFFDDEVRNGVSFRASHAALYRVEGLTSEQACGSLRLDAFRLELSHVQVGIPGVREVTTRLSVREGGDRVVALSLHLERLVLALEGEPPAGGGALGGGVRGHALLAGVRCDVMVAADRIVRRGESDVTPAVPWSVRLRARGASLEVADRWEGDGRTSPRLSFDLRAGGALALRFGRGERPGRTGAAAALRVGRIEVSVGRQDDEYGGSISSASVALLPGRPKR